MRNNRLEPQTVSDILGDLSGLADHTPGIEGQPLRAGTTMSDLLTDPGPRQSIPVSEFENGMLEAVRELNQNPELLHDVAKRIS